MRPVDTGYINPALTSLPKPGSSSPSNLGQQLLACALEPVAPDLEALQECIISYIPAQTETTAGVLHHIFSSGGKRIRPALYFFCCRMLGYRGDHLFPIAAVCEYIHTASLLHDDVVDNSSLRRNKPTANTIWGDQASVLVGDLIYSRASEMMAATGSLDIVTTFARAIRLMSEGELIQLEEVFSLPISVDRYFQILDKKTAVLIGASCKAAGILAKADSTQLNALETFGSSLGIAFQLVDDALDYLGSRELFGKPTLSDLREGKVTLPVILLRELASKQEITVLERILSKSEIESRDVEMVAGMVEEYNTANLTIDRAARYTDRAISALEKFPSSSERDDLENIAKCLVWRFN